jgi:hypothetical protein
MMPHPSQSPIKAGNAVFGALLAGKADIPQCLRLPWNDSGGVKAGISGIASSHVRVCRIVLASARARLGLMKLSR